MPSFDPKSEEHQQGAFIRNPGRYVFAIVAFKRMPTKGGAALITKCECVLGPHTGATIRRLFMMEGKGTRWFADLLNAVGCKYLNDTENDVEMSAAIGRRPFAAECDLGDPHATKVDKKTGEGVRYMEIDEVSPISNVEQAELQRCGFVYGIQSGSSIYDVKAFESKKQAAPHPADMPDSGGPQQAGGWNEQQQQPEGWGGGAPPPGEDDIPFR